MGNNVNTKMIGNVGEAKVLAKLVELQIPVYVQFGDNEPADYLILVEDKPYKVQVKTSTTFNGEITKFELTSSTAHRKKGYKHKYSKDEVDLFMCYDYCTDKIFIFKNAIPKCTVIVRYTHPQNNVIKHVNFVADCELTLDKLHSICNTR